MKPDYDELIGEIQLTCDEKTILLELLNKRLDECISVAEELTVITLIEKISFCNIASM